MNVRPASESDAARIAELHCTQITNGFLTQLGPGFLRQLYRRAVKSPDAFVLVADDGESVAGFVAGARDVSRFYRSFLLRDGAWAGVLAAPRLARSPRRAWETLRYPTATADLPAAEILATAVDRQCARRGIGRQLVDAATAELAQRDVTAAKVVAGADNEAAIRLYERCGFAQCREVAVHAETPSVVLVWHSS